ncbi:MAG: dTDP-4-dehydrorhamnose reductase [Wenzhouxiangellaceae bacterium]
MRILLLGANGQVGHELLRVLRPLGELIPLARQPLAGWPQSIAVDLTDSGAWADCWQRLAPRLIVNAAAWTAVDAAQADPVTAAVLNQQLPASLGEYAAASGARVVHLSTDYVFPGDAGEAYDEAASTGPQSVYGQTKLAGEQALIESAADTVIVRTSWVYSGRRHNFVRAMLSRMLRGEALRVVDDQIGCPTWARDIADGIGWLLRQWPAADEPRLYHLAGSDQASWHQFAAYIAASAEQLGLLPGPATLTAIATRDYPTPAPRPAWSVLNSDLFARQFGYRAGGWSSVDACLEELKEARCWFP